MSAHPSWCQPGWCTANRGGRHVGARTDVGGVSVMAIEPAEGPARVVVEAHPYLRFAEWPDIAEAYERAREAARSLR